MYLPQHFEESRVDVMHALIRAHPLATLVTLTTSGLVANHIPLLFAAEPPGPLLDRTGGQRPRRPDAQGRL